MQHSAPENLLPAPQTFKPDHECYDTTAVSGKKFYRNVQSTPWSSKAGLVGKDVIRLVDVTRKVLDDYVLRNLSNGEFQGVVFVRSVSEAVFTTNLLRLLRQDKVDLDKVAGHLHVAAPPDKHRESFWFMEPLLSEILQTFERLAPPEQPPENDELLRAKRKLQEAGLELTPPVKRRTSELSEPSSSAKKPANQLPVQQSPAEILLVKPVEAKPSTLPTANTKEAMDKWPKAHQGQFRGQALAFKKHVAEVTGILNGAGISKPNFVAAATKYGLHAKLAARLSITNLTTFIAACHFEPA